MNLLGLKDRKPQATKAEQLRIRWMIRRDMPQVVAIEQSVYHDAWTEQEFTDRLRGRNCVGMVAEIDDQVIGHLVYELHHQRLELLNVAVDPTYHRCGMATAMMCFLKQKLMRHERRHLIECCVPDANLVAHLWLKSQGFMAVDVWPEYFQGGMDAYRFQFHRNWMGASCNG